MMVAVIGGVHANFPALRASLEAIDEAGIHTILCTGNLAVGFGMPNEVVECISQRAIHCVQGAWDRLAVRASRKAESLESRLPAELARAIQRAHEELTSANIERLRSMPRSLSLTLDGVATCLCHGGPTGQTVELDKHGPLEKFRRQREAANAELIVCGSTALPYARWVDTALFVNPGRTGVPVGRPPAARFAVINTDSEPWDVTFPEVKYKWPEPGRPATLDYSADVAALFRVELQ